MFMYRLIRYRTWLEDGDVRHQHEVVYSCYSLYHIYDYLDGRSFHPYDSGYKLEHYDVWSHTWKFVRWF